MYVHVQCYRIALHIVLFFFFGNRTRPLAFLQSSSYENRGTKWNKIRVFGMLQRVCAGPHIHGHGGVMGKHVCGEMQHVVLLRIDTSSETPWGQRK
jgi:hypothetical protein